MAVSHWSAVSIMTIVVLYGQTVFAQTLQAQANAVKLMAVTNEAATATASEPSADNFSMPSLWWPHHQQGEAINPRLIDDWSAYDHTVSPIPYVDLKVNGQIWPLLNYLEQYAFITQFGESTKSYGYQLRVFTGSRLVGLYVCDFSDVPQVSETNDPEASPTCLIELDYLGQGSIRGSGQR